MPHTYSPFATALARSWWLLLLLGVMAVLFGLLAIFNPVRAGAGLAWAMGLLAIAEGLLTLVALFKKDVPIAKGWLLGYSAISLAFGVAALMNPVDMAAAFVMVTGAWVVIAGLVRAAMGWSLRMQDKKEWSMLVSGALAIVLGVLLMSLPVAGLILALVWIGVGAVVYGLLQIFAALRLRTQGRAVT